MPPAGGFAFGPFLLDTRSKRLLRSGEPVALSPRHFDLLSALVSRAGEVLSKNDLIQAVWQDVAVTDSSLVKVVRQVRELLDPADASRYIETVARRGYRFVATVTREDLQRADADLDDVLAPHRALIEGRAALETLEREQLVRARGTFEHLLQRHDREASFHVGLANACVLQYESTRGDPEPDTASLQLAVTHARAACRLDPEHAEAWATLGFVLERTGAGTDALAALRRATTLEPDNWRHQLRLAAASWGEERLRAARRTIRLTGECALARMLAATVYVAREAFREADQDLDAGLATMSATPAATVRFSAVALHWLKGLLCLARGADDEAMRAFEGELALESRGHLYARQYCAHTWYAIGAMHLGRGDNATARAAFEQAMARVPQHPMAKAGLTLLSGRRGDATSDTPQSMDGMLARAALFVGAGDAHGAGRVVAAALAAAPSGNAGWIVPIEPLLSVPRDRAAWAGVLVVLRARAS